MKADGPCPGSVANPEASCSASGVLGALGPGSVLLYHPPQPPATEDQEYGSPGEDGGLGHVVQGGSIWGSPDQYGQDHRSHGEAGPLLL